MFSVNSACRLLFSKLGYSISKYPKTYITCSVICSLALSAGIIRVNYLKDIEYLFPITNGIVTQEAARIFEFFPDNYNNYSQSRSVRPGKFARLIIQRKDGQSILDQNTWNEILAVDREIQNISIVWEEGEYKYKDLCATWNGECHQNAHLGVGNLLNQILNGSLRFSYPVMFNPINFEVYPINLVFGGVKLQLNSSTVDSIQAISLDYFLRNHSIGDNQRSFDWEGVLLERMEKLNQDQNILRVDYLTFRSFDDELEKNTLSSLPFAAVSALVTSIFVMCTSITGNWVTSKPLVSMVGLISCLLGISASFGFLALVGVPLISINTAVPFVALGVGIDDTFVFMASWWRTSRTDSVSKRLTECYAEAGISVTITTLTDMLSFYVGIWSSVPCIQIFCAYAGTSVFFIYLLQIFCFGPFMAISGQLEKENRHSLFPWKKLQPDSSMKPGNDDNESGNLAMEFFRDKFAPFLTNKFTKVASIILYVAYISVAVVGILNMKQGLENRNIAYWDSYMTSYYDSIDQYFREYTYRSQVVITTPLDYSNKEVQQTVEDYWGKLTHLKGLTPEYGENWLLNFLRFADNYGEFLNFTIDTEQDFIDIFRKFNPPGENLASIDVTFNENYTKIIASRFVVQHHALYSAQDEKDLLVSMRELSDSEKHFNVTVYNPFNLLIDISVALVPMTLKLVGGAAAVVMLVTMVFIPSAPACLFTLLSIISVQLGVVGVMVLWNVNLDFVSVIDLIMCIGFSVDFPAHLMYAYVSSEKESAQERVDDALYGLAWPILQAAASTVLCACGLIFVNSYIFQVVLKILCLVMLFSAFNTLFVLPVLLGIFKPKNNSKK